MLEIPGLKCASTRRSSARQNVIPVDQEVDQTYLSTVQVEFDCLLPILMLLNPDDFEFGRM